MIYHFFFLLKESFSSSKIVSLIQKDSQYYLTTKEDLWFVVKSLHRPYQLQEGQHFKMGRMHFHITELRTSNKSKIPSATHQHQVPVYSNASCFNETTSHPPCRFCLSVTIEPHSPLIRPCNCTGSVAYIHISCMQSWFNSKIQIKDCNAQIPGQIIFYGWKTLECEVCKKQYTCKFVIVSTKYQKEWRFKATNLIFLN